jgi:formylmethanofuran dehydrogenase subunit B
MEDIVCSGCSLLCDDVSAEVKGGEINSLGLCRLGHQHLVSAIEHLDAKSTIRDNGTEKTVSLDVALEKAAGILHAAKSPLLFGWSHSTDEAISKGFELASSIGATFDTLASLGITMALSHELHSKQLEIDLDYVRNNGEFILYWGSDPTESSHRHPSKFAVLPRGENIPEGIESRTIGVVDVRNTETMKMANHRLIIPPGADAELLDVLSSDITGRSPITGDVVGIPAQELLGLVRNMKKSDCTVIFYGSGLINSGAAEENFSRLQMLVEAIRGTGKKAFALPMATEPNIMGIARKTADSDTRNTLSKLVAGEFDAALVVSDDPLSNLPGPAAKALARIPTIYVGSPGSITGRRAMVSIHTTNSMLLGSGTMQRLDYAEITFKRWSGQPKKFVDESDVLTRLNDLVNKGKD